jgi:hypothetical protein
MKGTKSDWLVNDLHLFLPGGLLRLGVRKHAATGFLEAGVGSFGV